MDYKFEKLTPKKDTDIAVYEDALNFVFSNNDVQNVAISGSYGAGKSSVLASYEQTHPEKAFVHISLAHFQDDKSSDIENENAEGESESLSTEAVLEGKILNQLIHQIDPGKIPQTNFRVKKTTSKGKLCLYCALSLLLLLNLLHSLFFVGWSSFVETLSSTIVSKILLYTINPYARLITGGCAFLIFACFVYLIIRAQSNKNIFKKLNFNGTEIEIFENSNESYFDKYLNEVLYLFEQIDADVIVFEDVDRYDDCKIFERLREINTLVNLHLKRSKKYPLRFFYLLKDDIFASKDRTKFFDFIVPVVPVVDGSNSFNQFKEHLGRNKIFEKFDVGFLQGLSLYVDEMRLLKNICNEFIVYHGRIAQSIDLNYNKMFAMIVYKNIFPRDFSELQLGRGFVAALFENKPKFIEAERAKIEAQIEEILAWQKKAKAEIAKQQSELDLVFKNRITYNPHRNRSDWSEFLDVEDQKEYQQRCAFLLKGIWEEKERELAQLRKELTKVQTMQLAEIINRGNIAQIFSLTTQNEMGVPCDFCDIKSSNYFNLLKYLIRNGYIDESYSDYMTYFYANSLTGGDKNFLISVTDKIAREYTYELKNPELVFSMLREVDFDQEEVLNFSLLEHLLKRHYSSEHLKRFVAQLKETQNYEFISQFYCLTEEANRLTKIINELWPTFFSEVLKNGGFSSEQIKQYSIDTLCESDASVIMLVNVDNCLLDYISKNQTYLEIIEPNVEKLIAGFQLLNVKFVSIDYDRSNKELFKQVYQHHFYMLSFDNICLMLQKIHNVTSSADVIDKNYTLILQLFDSPVFQYVSENISDYVEVYLSANKGEICDSEYAALQIINNENVTLDQKKRYIASSVSTVAHVDSILEKSLWPYAIENGIVLWKEDNAFKYYQYSKKIDPILVEFINCFPNHALFSYKNIQKGDAEEKVVDAFVEAFISADDIDSAQYESMIRSLDFQYSEFDFVNLSDSKMEIILRAKIVEMNKANLLFFRERYSRFVLGFIETNFDSYVKIMDDSLFLLSELERILLWEVDDDYKLKLLEFADEPISIVRSKVSTQIKLYVLKHNQSEEDVQYLYQKYSVQEEEIKEYTYYLAKENIATIIEENFDIDFALCDRIWLAKEIDVAERINLFAAKMSCFTKGTAVQQLQRMGIEGFKDTFDERKRPKFVMNNENAIILQAFVDQGWIAGFEENPARPGYYKLKKMPKVKKLDPVLL